MLDGEILEGGLDHEVAAGEVGKIGRQRQPPDRVVSRRLLELPLLDLAGQEVRDPVPRRFAPGELDLGPIVSKPDSTASWAMPAPIVPRPTTLTRRISRAVVSRGMLSGDLAH